MNNYLIPYSASALFQCTSHTEQITSLLITCTLQFEPPLDCFFIFMYYIILWPLNLIICPFNWLVSLHSLLSGNIWNVLPQAKFWKFYHNQGYFLELSCHFMQNAISFLISSKCGCGIAFLMHGTWTSGSVQHSKICSNDTQLLNSSPKCLYFIPISFMNNSSLLQIQVTLFINKL